jgi:hypothetical protein
MDLQNGEIDDEGVSNRWQLGGTAGMERFRLAIVSIRNEGVVMCSDFQMNGSRDFLRIPPVSCRDTDWSIASDYKC